MIEPSISIRDIVLEFEPGQRILDRVSLDIPAGQFVSIVGPSGCGKTTMLNIVAGLVSGSFSDSVRILGETPHLGNRAVAYMLARDSLLPWRTALENACYGLQVRGVSRVEREARANALLQSVGLRGYEQAYPKQLSHGMRQRCALARTFALPTPVLLMDEPFGALDAQTKVVLEELLVELWQQERRTVIFITHDLAEAVAISDRVIVMSSRPGRIVADVDICLERPRHVRGLQKDKKFHELCAHIWEKLEQGWVHDTDARGS
jgi:NitT/TauT family transport system ATP-binding protein